MRQRESYYNFVFGLSVGLLSSGLVHRPRCRPPCSAHTSQTYWSLQSSPCMRTERCTKISNYRSGFFLFMKSPSGLSCGFLCLSGDSRPRGAAINERAACLCCNGPFRIQPSQLPGQSMTCLFVCACLLFSHLFFCPLPCLLSSFLHHLSVVCPIDLFVSAPLMVPLFGGFVNTLGVIAILCGTTKKRKGGGIKMSFKSPELF